MHAVHWACLPPPDLDHGCARVQRWPLRALPELPVLRDRLRHVVTLGPASADTDALERLLLTVDELASNGLRHGRPPIEVTVSTTTRGWLVDVTDAATDLPPIPAPGRDPSQGGLGLQLVAQLCPTYGWSVDQDRKHVWACLDRQRR